MIDINSHIECFEQHLIETVPEGQFTNEHLANKWRVVLESNAGNRIENSFLEFCISSSLESQQLFNLNLNHREQLRDVNEYQQYALPLIRRQLSEEVLSDAAQGFIIYSPTQSYTISLEDAPVAYNGQDRDMLRLEWAAHEMINYLKNKTINGLLIHFHSGESDVELTIYH